MNVERWIAARRLGRLTGAGLLAEAQTDYFPARGFATERLRLDIAQYEQLWGRSLLALQAMVFLGSTPIGGPILGWI